MRIHLVSLILVALAQANEDKEIVEVQQEPTLEVEVAPGVFEEILAGDKIPPPIEVTVHAEEDHNDEAEVEAEEPQDDLPESLADMDIPVLSIDIEGLLTSGRRHVDAWNGLNFCPAEETSCAPFFQWDPNSCQCLLKEYCDFGCDEGSILHPGYYCSCMDEAVVQLYMLNYGSGIDCQGDNQCGRPDYVWNQQVCQCTCPFFGACDDGQTWDSIDCKCKPTEPEVCSEPEACGLYEFWDWDLCECQMQARCFSLDCPSDILHPDYYCHCADQELVDQLTADRVSEEPVSQPEKCHERRCQDPLVYQWNTEMCWCDEIPTCNLDCAHAEKVLDPVKCQCEDSFDEQAFVQQYNSFWDEKEEKQRHGRLSATADEEEFDATTFSRNVFNSIRNVIASGRKLVENTDNAVYMELASSVAVATALLLV